MQKEERCIKINLALTETFVNEWTKKTREKVWKVFTSISGDFICSIWQAVTLNFSRKSCYFIDPFCKVFLYAIWDCFSTTSASNSPCLCYECLLLFSFLEQLLWNYTHIGDANAQRPRSQSQPKKKSRKRDHSQRSWMSIDKYIFILHTWHQLKATATTSFIIIKYIFTFVLRDELKAI